MSMPVRRRFLVLLSVLSLTACATNQFTGTQVASSGVSLKNARLQVYSFLDIRDVEFGPQMLNEVDRQLAAALSAESVQVRTLRFKESEPGKYFSSTNAGVRVPVGETISSNRVEEREFPADLRLIVFPSKMTLSGAWKFYDVRWELQDVNTGRIVWTTTSHGKHLNAWKNDENPEERAKTIVDGIMNEFRGSKAL
ncbi:MAG TPA: hypothetical protein VFE82_03515 [Ramlibacter sp.]|jgi:predicted small secreted protein|uniref:hypothetical protein n=1 Tax=Ramlibacter sp. TaxID=1917967 RepID=UPI002D323A60|nr:hypothetical protein [Ramlibacter sp.]HZY17520.1 hypothetical protein [Ramlibacter sp.]